MSTTSLRQRVLHAGTWSMVGFCLTQVIRLGGNLITTRLLVPDMFGVMAIAQVLMFGLVLFSDFGLNQNVVQSRRGNDPIFFNTAWVVQILRGVVIGIFSLLLSVALAYSPFLQRFLAGSVYSDHRLPYIIAALAFITFISGFESSKLALASRNLALGRVTQIDLFCQIIGLACMIPWAMLSPSIWALVAGGLIPALAKTILSHLCLPGQRNSFTWDRHAFHEILGFGKWTILSSILWFLVSSGDRLMLGGMVTPEILGLYATALLLVSAFQQALAKLVASVAFPALSEVVRERPLQVCSTYYRIRLPIDIVALLLSGFLLFAGNLIIRVLYDNRYSGSGHILQILALTLIMSRYFVTDQCFVAMGKPRILALLNLVRTIALYVLVPAGYVLYGYSGAIWAIALSSFSGAPIMFYLKKKFNLLDWKREIVVLPIFFVGIAGGLIFKALISMYGFDIN